MCFYLTTTMAPRGDEEAIQALAKQFGLRWELIDHPTLRKSLLVEGERYYSVTSNGCDCGTQIGSLDQHDELVALREARIASQIAKHRKQGWTEAKISRWAEQVRGGHHSDESSVDGGVWASDSEIGRWLEFLRVVTKGRHSRWIGIFKHWYDNDLENEEFEELHSTWQDLESLSSSMLLHLKQDTLYRIRLFERTR